jgi:hypothetical protein
MRITKKYTGASCIGKQVCLSPSRARPPNYFPIPPARTRPLPLVARASARASARAVAARGREGEVLPVST